MDTDTLEEVTVVQASHAEANLQASKSRHDVCCCKGNYVTNNCCCKEVGNKCSTMWKDYAAKIDYKYFKYFSLFILPNYSVELSFTT